MYRSSPLLCRLQMAQYNLFQQYYDSQPATHTPPIPSVSVQPAVSARLLRNVCYQQRYLTEGHTVSEEDIRKTAAAILAGAKQLDSNPHAQAIWAHDASIANTNNRKYIIKRNHAGFARKVIKITLGLNNWQQTPSLRSLLQGSNSQSQAKHANNTDAAMNSCDSNLETQASPHTDSTCPTSQGASGNASVSKPNHTSLHSNVSHAPGVFQEGVMPGTAAESKPVNSTQQDAAKQEPLSILHDAQQLLKAAERMLLESCGEDWLLQPFIHDMGTAEYRYAPVLAPKCTLPSSVGQP